MSETLDQPRVSADERLLLTIVIAAAVHAMVVLGVRFTPEAPVKSRFSAMEVVLVPAAAPMPVSTAVLPDTANAVAPDTDEPPLLTMPAVDKPVIKAAPAPVISPVKVAPPRPAAKPAPRPAAPKVSAAALSPINTASTPTHATNEAAPPPLPSAAQLIERSLAIAATGAGLIEEKTVSGQSISERTVYLSTGSRNPAHAYYAHSVANKAAECVERGGAAVPEGRVEVEVPLASDGSLAGDILITMSSRSPATDARVVSSIEACAPYAPPPREAMKDKEIARVQFTHRITNEQGFSSGQ